MLSLLLLLSHFSRVQLCETPETAARQAPPSPGLSRQEHWSGLPFPSPMHESEKWKWNRSVVSDSLQPHGLQPIRLLCPWDFPGKSTGVGCHCFLRCFHCCAWILFWSANWDPSSCAIRQKKRRKKTEILLLKIKMNEMQQNKKCYREHQQQQKNRWGTR